MNRLSSIVVRHSSSKSFKKLQNLLISMPQRDTSHIDLFKKQRIKMKEKNSKYVPGSVSIQILGSGAVGSTSSIYIFTDNSRYLFNCGEGTQRLAHEHRTKLARLEQIFLTRTAWDRLGGLPGLCLTVQESGVPNLTLHGPPGVEDIFKAMKRFVVLKDLNVDTVICGESQEIETIFEDNILTVKAVSLYKPKSNAAAVEQEATDWEKCVDTTDYYAGIAGNEKSSSSQSTVEPVSKQFVHIRREEDYVVSYICRLKPKPGALSLEKCVEKGVPPGPLLGQLKNGLDVKLADGTVVKSIDVTLPDDMGPVFIFLDIPSEEYLVALEQKSDQFAPYQSTASGDDDVAMVVVHFTPQHIIESEIYQKFVDKFTPSTSHLVLNETNKFSGYVAAHKIQWQLNQINKDIFPILGECKLDIRESIDDNPSKRIRLEENNSPQSIDSNENSLSTPTKIGPYDNVSSLTSYHLRPKKGLERNNEPHLENEYLETMTDVRKLLSNNGLHIDQIRQHFPNPGRAAEYPKIVFLGTGSCIPNKTRNVSSILVHISPESCILLDCGEGTCGQLYRFYGKVEGDAVMRRLKAIYISHLHADHHIGFIGLVQKRRQLMNDDFTPVLLFAPQQIQSWLYLYDRLIERIQDDFVLVSNAQLISNALDPTMCKQLDLTAMKMCYVKHCPHSFAVALDIKGVADQSPTKITYSGDTMPCDDLVVLGQDSTILIHEATMEDELFEEAQFKMHSTISQAIEQGIRMNAKYTLLTHFSQRYAKLPRLDKDLNQNIGIAFDNMEVTVSDLPHLHSLYPAMKTMFMDHCDEMDHKAMKRALKKKRAETSPSQSIV